jgi:two-component system, NtrC family, sensor histidine kinase HydH
VDVRTQAFLLTALIAAILAIAVWTRKERSRTTLPFSLTNMFLFAYAAFYVGMKITGENLFLRAFVASAMFLMPSYLYLVYSYLFRQSRFVEIVLVALFGIAAVFAVSAFIPRIDTVMHFLSMFPPSVRKERAAAAVVVIGLPTLLLILSRLFREKEPFLKKRYSGLLVVSTLAIGLISLDQVIGRGTASPIAQVVFHYYLYRSLVLFQTFSLRETMSRIAMLAFLMLFLALYGLFFFLVYPRPIPFLLHTVLAAFLLMVLYEPFATTLESRAREFIFRGRGAGRRIDKIVSELAQAFSLESIGEYLVNRVPGELGLRGASIYLSSEDGGMSRVATTLTAPDHIPKGTVAALSRHAPGPITLEKLVQLVSEGYPGQEAEQYTALIDLLQQTHGFWLVPLRHRKELIGLYIPSSSTTPRTGGSADWVFATLADHAAVRIANAHIYQKLRSQDRLATLGELAASLAHEVRNPLGSMKGAAQYLLDEKLPEGSREFVQIIADEADRLNGVLTRYLDYARPFELNREPIDVNDLIRETVAFLSEGEKPEQVEIRTELDGAIGTQNLDGAQLRQVLINLIKNAWQTQQAGGEILVSSKYTEDSVQIEVADRGPGISPVVRDKLFMPFFSTQKGGTGLGLTISLRIAQAHGGQVTVQPRPGGGSRFIVELPTRSIEMP